MPYLTGGGECFPHLIFTLADFHSVVGNLTASIVGWAIPSQNNGRFRHRRYVGFASWRIGHIWK